MHLIMVLAWGCVLAVAAFAAMKLVRVLGNKRLVHMANSGAALGAESHGTGNIPYLVDAAFIAQVTAHASAAHAGRYLLCKKGADEETATSTTLKGESGVFGICTDEPDSTDRKFNVAILGNGQGSLPVAIGGTVAAFDYLVANTDGTAVKLPADGSGAGGVYYVIGRVLRAHVAGDVGEVQHCVPFPVTVAA